MRGKRLFKVNILKTCAGRYRWTVEVRGDAVAAGYSATKGEALAETRQSQKRLLKRYGNASTERSFLQL